MAPSAEYRVESDGVAVITLSNPPVNALHPAGNARGSLHGQTAAAGAASQVTDLLRSPLCLPHIIIPAVLKGLFDSLRRAHADPNVKAVVVTGRCCTPAVCCSGHCTSMHTAQRILAPAVPITAKSHAFASACSEYTIWLSCSLRCHGVWCQFFSLLFIRSKV